MFAPRPAAFRRWLGVATVAVLLTVGVSWQAAWAEGEEAPEPTPTEIEPPVDPPVDPPIEPPIDPPVEPPVEGPTTSPEPTSGGTPPCREPSADGDLSTVRLRPHASPPCNDNPVTDSRVGPYSVTDTITFGNAETHPVSRADRVHLGCRVFRHRFAGHAVRDGVHHTRGQRGSGWTAGNRRVRLQEVLCQLAADGQLSPSSLASSRTHRPGRTYSAGTVEQSSVPTVMAVGLIIGVTWASIAFSPTVGETISTTIVEVACGLVTGTSRTPGYASS